MKKFEFTGETKTTVNGIVLHRIKALVRIDLGYSTIIEVGDLGGWLEKEDNLSYLGNAWVSGDAEVFGDAKIYGDALISGYSRVFGDAEVFGDAKIYGDSKVYDDACINKCSHILNVGPIGRRNEFTTFFRTKDRKVKVSCGCFLGTIDEFLEKVEQTHGDSKHAIVYRAAADIALAQIDISDEYDA